MKNNAAFSPKGASVFFVADLKEKLKFCGGITICIERRENNEADPFSVCKAYRQRKSKSLRWKINKVNSEVTQWQKKGRWISILFVSFIWSSSYRNSSNDAPFLLSSNVGTLNLPPSSSSWMHNRKKGTREWRKLCTYTHKNKLDPFLDPLHSQKNCIFVVCICRWTKSQHNDEEMVT